MAISEARKVDYLWKKIGYGATKSDTNANKAAPNEAIASPLLLRGDKTWNQANLIPTTMPGSSAGVVTVYGTSAPDTTTNDATSSTNRTWKTGLTDWIPPEFGATYGVKVYIHDTGSASAAAASGTRVFAGGSGNEDEYFFDYQSGVLHFIGSNLPNGVNFSGKTAYISGARYTGTQGLQNIANDLGDFGFSGNILSTGSSNADMEFDTAGTGKYLFKAETGVVLPAGNTAARPSAQEGVLRFNTQTAEYEVSKDGSTWTNLRTDADASAISKDIFAGDGSTTTFTMSLTPTDENNIVVYVDGVMQEPDQNYTISSTTIDFGDAAHDGARIVVMHGFAD
jgi:hypothetical protein